MASRRGTQQWVFAPAADQTQVTIQVVPDLVDLASRGRTEFAFTLEGSEDGGATWRFMASADATGGDLLEACTQVRHGVSRGHVFIRLTEQIYRDATTGRKGYPTRRKILPAPATKYSQLPLPVLIRVTVAMRRPTGQA